MSDQDTQAADGRIGQRIRGYELREMIGIGGFGAVYRAYQEVVDREVAVKIILPEHASDPDFIRRFEREAQYIARLEHLHIIPIYDFWRDPSGAYLVMRYLKGGNLLSSLEVGGPWPLPAAALLVDQIASALSAAHRGGIVHQDIKPENILLDHDHNGYLSDFGIAKDLSRGGAGEASERYGSPGYASPEQILGHPVTPMSDIFSFSLVIYALLTGGSPFKDDNTFTLLRKTVYEPLPSILEKRPDLPPEIDRVLGNASAKDPYARYQDAMALAADFRRASGLAASAGDTGTWAAALPPHDGFARPTTQRQSTQLLTLLEVQPRNPYKGLRPFDETDSRDFFGRDDVVRKLLSRLGEAGVYSRFLAVVGASGAGKSSVVSAGLLPALRRGELAGAERWFITEMTPGDSPLKSLEEAVLRVAVDDLDDDLAAAMRADDECLHRALRLAVGEADTEVLLVIDQFEEAFAALVTERDCARFLDNLVVALTSPESRLRVIITLRADFIERPLSAPGFGALMRDRTEFILPMSEAELTEAITRPALNAGLTLEENLAADILRDLAGGAGALPLLQFALTELFERRAGKQLTLSAYREIGGVAGALVRRADELYAGLSAERGRVARQIFQRLVLLGDGVDDTRRRLPRHELTSLTASAPAATVRQSAEADAVLDLFGQYRLLTFDRDPVTRAPTVEIAHEALLRGWARLRNWLDESRDALRAQSRLSIAAGDWSRAGRDRSFLADGARLVGFEALLTDEQIALSANERAYLLDSIRARQVRARRRQLLVAALTLTAAVMALLAVIAFEGQGRAQSESDRAEVQASIADARRLANNATIGRERLDARLLYSLQSLATFDTVEGRASLLNSLLSNPRLTAILSAPAEWGASVPARALAISLDGAWLAVGREDGTILLWDVATRQPIGEPLRFPAGESDAVAIRALAISPDGAALAAASADGRVGLWALGADATATLTVVLDAHPGGAWALDFSPDGATLATVGEDGRALLWPLDAGDESPQARVVYASEKALYAIAFSPDGATLAFGGADQQVWLWPLAGDDPADDLTPEGIALEGHTNWITTLDFSPDGRYLGSSGPEALVYLWDVARGAPLFSFSTGHAREVSDLAFAPGGDGLTLATTSLDNTVKTWDLSTGRANAVTLAGHIDAVREVIFVPDGRQLVSASSDGSAIIWTLSPARSLARALTGHRTPVWEAVFSPDGAWLATGSARPETADGEGAPELRLWRAGPDGAFTAQTLGNYGGAVYALAFSPDSATLLAGSEDRSVTFWSPAEGRALAQFRGAAGVSSAAFAPDGLEALTGDAVGTVSVWRLGDAGWAEAEPAPLTRNSAVVALAYAPDGQAVVASYADRALWLWDRATGGTRALDTPRAHNDIIEALAFSPDGAALATGGRDNRIVLWDTATWAPGQIALEYHTNWVTALAFSPDGATLASASRDASILLWEAATGKRYDVSLAGHSQWINALAFSPDGAALASAAWDTRVILWEMRLDAWRAAACAVANRDLTLEEWRAADSYASYRPLCAPTGASPAP